ASNFARLDIGNTFTNKKQTLALSSTAFASLNIPVNGASPTIPVKGDIWTLSTDPHLNFQNMNNMTQTLTFFSNISTANAGTLASANSYTDAQVLIEKNRATKAENTLTTNLNNKINQTIKAETTETTQTTNTKTLLKTSITTKNAHAINIKNKL